MESSRFRLLPLLGASLLLLLPLLGARAQEDAELQPRALDIYSAVDDVSHEKELVGIPTSLTPVCCSAVPSFVRVPSLFLLPNPISRVRARGDEPQVLAPAVIRRPSRAHGLLTICRANLLSPLL